MNTKSAGPLEDQATGSTYQAKTTSVEGGLRDYVAETPQEGPVAGPSNDVPPASDQVKNPNAQLNDDNNDVSVYEPSYTTGSSNNDQVPTSAAPPSGELDEEIQLNKKIARLEAKKQLLKKRQKLATLQDRKSRGFPLDKDKSFDLYKQDLALKQSKSAYKLVVYTGTSQRALNEFFKQVELVFRTKPLTYQR